MKIYYRVLSVDEKNHSIAVRYFTDEFSEESLAISYDPYGELILNANGYPERCQTDYNITFYDLANPSEEQIIEKIKQTCPIQWFEVLLLSKTGEYSLDNANALLNKSNYFNSEEINQVVVDEESLEQEYEKIVNRVFDTSTELKTKIKNLLNE
jgi:hypothetical protein